MPDKEKHTSRVPTQTIADNDFDLRQHDALRQEIQTAEASARANERYAIVALAAVWAWTAKEAPAAGFVTGTISFLIGLLGALRLWALWINMKTKGDYIAQIEHILARECLGGWEHYFRDATARKTTIPARAVEREADRNWQNSPGGIGYTGAAFWIIVIIMSPLLGWYVTTLTKSGEKPPTVEVRCVASR